MMRIPNHLRCALVSVLSFAVVCWSARSSAEPTVAELYTALRGAPDFRVRVQAALALGASKEPTAVPPLCHGLMDSNPTVRTAAAAALGRLKMQQGRACLERQNATESDPSVKAQYARSIQQIADAAPAVVMSRAPNASTKWYIAVSPTKNKGKRSVSEIDAVVQTAVRSALLANEAAAVAPVGETSAQAASVLEMHKVRGYVLQPTVEEPEYANSSLTVVVRLAMLSYPNLVLMGEFTPKLTMSDTPTEDKKSEDELIKAASERAVMKFIQVAEAHK